MNPTDVAPCPGCGGAMSECGGVTDRGGAWWYLCYRCGWKIREQGERWTWEMAAEAFPLVKLLLAEVVKLRAQGVDVWGEPAHGEDLDRG